MCGEDEKFKILERLIYLDGGIDPRTGERVMSHDLYCLLIDDELRSLDGPKRFDTWDRLTWCKAPVRDEANT